MYMNVHFILSGETLESISQEIHLENPEYLKEFHNAHCARQDIIYNKLIAGKKLLLPDGRTITKYNSKNDAPFKAPAFNPEIPFNPEHFSRIFSVSVFETEENGLEKKSNSLTYTASLQWIRKEGNFHIFYLFRNNFSDQQGSMMSDLASESIRAINPFVIKTDEKGEIITIALNEKAAHSFGRIKDRLLDLFPDQYARIYLDEFEFAVTNKDLFDKRMKEDIFMKIYFAPLRNHFKNGESLLYQSVGEENIRVEIAQKVESQNIPEEIIFQQREMSQQGVAFNGIYTVWIETGLVKKAEISYVISHEDIKSYTSVTIQ